MPISVRAPRAATALVAALLVVTGVTLAAPGASGQTPSPSPSGSGPAAGITLLNPSAAHGAPNVGDRFDGFDARYPIVARATGPAPAVVEVSIAPQSSDGTWGNDLLIGEMTPATQGSGIWELDWDIPSSMPEGTALLTVRAYVDSAQGFVETGSDSVEVSVFYSDPTQAPVGAWETVHVRWPEQGGALGFYKPRVGAWRTVIDGTVSPGTNFVQLLVSTTPPGQPLGFVPCGSGTLTNAGTHATFTGRCTLDALTMPSAVTAVAAVADFREGTSGVRFPQTADVRVVDSYDLSPADMSVEITPVARRVMAPAASCQQFTVTVTDEHDRPVVGANVDIHATGPADPLILAGSGLVVPDPHGRETTAPCPQDLPVESPLPPAPRAQGDHNVPGGIDTKHMETNQGTGLDVDMQPSGVTRFTVASEYPGITELLAWVDDEEIRNEADQRPADDDRLAPDEPTGRARVQWLAASPTVTLDPVGGTAPVGSCFPYVVRARAGTDPMPRVNVDVHATAPDGELDFCDPPGASERRAPTAGSGANAHEEEAGGEAHHAGSAGPAAQHTEGETDSAGNFVVGLTSPATGDSTVVAWIDGEPGADDDVQGGAETSASGTISWARSAAEAELGFVNPSPYGGTTAGAGTGTQVPDSGGAIDVFVRVDMAAAAPGVDVLLARGSSTTFELLGEAERVGSTDLYRLEWRVGVPDGAYTLRARITGTQVVEDLRVTVGAGERLPMVPNPSHETLELQVPAAGAGAPFARRSTTVTGSASAGAEGVDVYYTKVPAKDTPQTGDWIFCGYADLDGTGAGRQDFSTPCALAGADQAAQVTGIAAITFDCTVDGCDSDPFPRPPAEGAPAPREQGQKETGAAVRVFGYEAHPLLAVEPPETQALVGECRRLEVVLRDQTRQPIAGANADLHLEGGSDTHFCRPEGAPAALRAPDAGGHSAAGPAGMEAGHADGAPGLHAEGETFPDGTLVFGVTSPDPGDVRVTAWLDRNDDDAAGADELTDDSLLHWASPSGCTVFGGEGPDTLRGTAGDDVICGLEGNDVIRGRGGTDLVFGGEGADRVFGGGGDDTLRAGRGRDFLDGGPGRDTCRGGPGRDRASRCEAPARGGRAAAPRRSGV
ncbi:MAG TPA: calcium-binding protein [Actinomycetota bacterium]|nr:calcium-binding protein [Actinomycetota bacterium]